MENVYLGTTVKLAVQATGTPNVSMDDCDFDVYVWANKTNTPRVDKPSANVVHRAKVNTTRIEKGIYCVEVPTNTIGRGYIVVRIEMQVPDTDCATGYRPEVEQLVANIEVL